VPYYEVILTIADQQVAHLNVPVGETRGGANLWGDDLMVIYHPEELPDETGRRDDLPQGIQPDPESR